MPHFVIVTRNREFFKDVKDLIESSIPDAVVYSQVIMEEDLVQGLLEERLTDLVITDGECKTWIGDERIPCYSDVPREIARRLRISFIQPPAIFGRWMMWQFLRFQLWRWKVRQSKKEEN